MSDSSARPDPLVGPDTAAMAALAALLWQERELLENVLFRMTELQHLLSAGAVRWLPKACAEVADAATAVQNFEILRSIEVDLLSRNAGLAPDVALSVLAQTAPEPWPALLLDHRDALRTLTLEIDTVAAENRRLVLAGEQATSEALHRVTGGAAGVSAVTGAYPGVSAFSRLDAARVLDQRA